MKSFILTLSTCLIFSHFSSSAQNTNSGYRIDNTIKLPGDGGWDYLYADELNNRLFVSHGTIVQVVDLKYNKLVGTIPDTRGVHGIAIANDLGKGFISNGKDTSVTIFNLKTLSTITKLRVTGNNPDAILYDIFSHRIFTFNGRGKNSTVIDAATNNVVGTIELPGKPEFAVSNMYGRIYVNIEDNSLLCEIDPITMKVLNSWSIAPGEEPSGLALDIKNNRLFTVCDNKTLVVLDALTGKVITSLPIGEGVDGVAFDPGTGRIFSSNGDGTMTIIEEISANEYKVLGNLTTQKGARTIAVNTRTHHLYLPCAEFGEVPAPTADKPHPRAPVKPESFVILDIATLE